MFVAVTRRPSATRMFARGARIAMLGLLAPGIGTVAAAAAGYSLVSWQRALCEAIPAFAFAAAGLWIAGQLGLGRRLRLAAMTGLGAAGVCVSYASFSLRGLTGHESVGVATTVVVGAFALGFAIPGWLLSRAGESGHDNQRPADGAGRRWVRPLAGSAFFGGLGGCAALTPFYLRATWPDLSVPYLSDIVAIAAFFASVLLPFHGVALGLDRRVPDRQVSSTDTR